jgi:hypothetical protein
MSARVPGLCMINDPFPIVWLENLKIKTWKHTKRFSHRATAFPGPGPCAKIMGKI